MATKKTTTKKSTRTRTTTTAAKSKKRTTKKPAAKKPNRTKPTTDDAAKKPASGAGLVGVRRSRPAGFKAGKVFAKHGLEHGITEEMVIEFHDAIGMDLKKSDRMYVLNIAWHACCAFNGGYPEPPNEE